MKSYDILERSRGAGHRLHDPKLCVFDFSAARVDQGRELVGIWFPTTLRRKVDLCPRANIHTQAIIYSCIYFSDVPGAPPADPRPRLRMGPFFYPPPQAAENGRKLQETPGPLETSARAAILLDSYFGFRVSVHTIQKNTKIENRICAAGARRPYSIYILNSPATLARKKDRGYLRKRMDLILQAFRVVL